MSFLYWCESLIRMCGLVVCDRCSMNRALLPHEQIVYDPSTTSEQKAAIAASPQRLCDSCSIELHAPPNRPSISSISIPPILRRSMSAQSVMRECPVCGRRLSSVGNHKDEQELHVQACLDGENPVVQRVKYVCEYPKFCRGLCMKDSNIYIMF
jgi:hypothetical protein